MASSKPSIPKGTRDFSPEQMVKRNYIFDVIRKHFVRFGFLPIETPAMENLSTLMGKYGDEGDKLIFKILNSGNYLAEFDQDSKVLNAIKDGEKKFSQSISEKALKYDLTVPFARYVVQHQNEITFPFKRYQIQPVWRADRPQKGRYREFYQCDADCIGTESLLNEVELICLIQSVLADLKIKAIVKLNNRKILSGIAEQLGSSIDVVNFTVTLDKLDKIGKEAVIKEFQAIGLNENTIEKLQPLLDFDGNTVEKIAFLKGYLVNSQIGLKGISEMEEILETLRISEQNTTNVELDLTLARGLNYYTGAIFEVKAVEGSLRSSICGGGRYDDLTGIFGLSNMSGVGISFGADRIYDVMEELNLFPDEVAVSTKFLFVNFGPTEQNYCLPLLMKLRFAGISAEIYPESTKMKKQFSYADNKKIPYVILVGTDEMNAGQVTLKNMKTGEQQMVNFNYLLELQ